MNNSNKSDIFYLRRADLKDEFGRLSGVFHIMDPENPKQGLCYVSSEKHLSELRGNYDVKASMHKDIPPLFTNICLICLSIYEKKEKTMKITTIQKDKKIISHQ